MTAPSDDGAAEKHRTDSSTSSIAGPRGVRLEFIDQPDIDPGAILQLIQSAPRTYRLDGPNRLRILGDMPDVESRIKAIGRILDALMPDVKTASRR